jgi:hypothetical protein
MACVPGARVGLGAVLAGAVFALAASGPPARPALAYDGHLRAVFGDVKRSLKGVEGAITEANYRKIVDGLKQNLHVTGLRVYLDPAIARPEDYPQIFQDTLGYARAQGLALYANPLGTGHFGKSADEFAAFVADHANHWKPEFLGPFNESGFAPAEMADIVAKMRRRLTYQPKLVGPDRMHIRDTLKELEKRPQEAALFDIVSSHNAAKDEGATAWAWWKLGELGGKPIWSSENPRDYDEKNAGGEEIGVRAVVATAGPVEGLVIYLAFPRCVSEDGSLTPKGQAIAQGIGTP